MSLKMRLSDDYLVRYEVTDNTEIFQIIYHLENKLIYTQYVTLSTYSAK